MRFALVFVLLLMGTVSAIDICIDLDAPSAPGNLDVSGKVGSILISWDAAVDTPNCSRIDYYNISRDNKWIGTTGNLSFVDNASLGAGSYNYTVYAVDMVGGNAGASEKNTVIIGGNRVRGGGGGSSYTCEVNWSCGEWSECAGGEERRVCEDVNECGTPYLKPEVYQECGGGGSEDEGESMTLESVVDEADVSDGSNFFSAITGAVVGGGASSVAGVIALLVLSLLILIVVIRKKRKGKILD